MSLADRTTPARVLFTHRFSSLVHEQVRDKVEALCTRQSTQCVDVSRLEDAARERCKMPENSVKSAVFAPRRRVAAESQIH